MKTLKSRICDRWHEADGGFSILVDPATEETIARASSEGIDFVAALEHARKIGGRALRALSVGQRAELLKAMSKALHERRDELLDLSVRSTGTTRKDAKFDVDGATGTLAYYAAIGRAHGEARYLLDGPGEALGRSARFWGQHVLLPRRGAAVLINAYNFPAWGFGEKAAAAILAGMPIVVKPATSTAWLTERCVEIVVEAGILPDGVLSLVCGSTGALLGALGPQDVLSFTGSADTALRLRSGENLLRHSTRVNVEADSLNAAVLGTDVLPGSGDTWDLFVADVVREMTQKTGQKCTAVRRIFVPRSTVDEVVAALSERLADVVTGNPADPAVTMGPLATAAQLEDTLRGITALEGAAQRVLGSGARVDGVGSPAGKGFFVEPTLLRADDAAAAAIVHEREVFGPVATVLPYDGPTVEAAALVGLGGGSLVTSLYADDEAEVGSFLAEGAAYCGRLYLGSEKMAAQAPGSGVALPQCLHGGPGRAGGGEELGALRALALYCQRVALQGSRPMLQRIAGKAPSDPGNVD